MIAPNKDPKGSRRKARMGINMFQRRRSGMDGCTVQIAEEAVGSVSAVFSVDYRGPCGNSWSCPSPIPFHMPHSKIP